MADGAEGTWLGTAVRFRSPHFFITCAHVVADYVDEPERISFYWLGELPHPNGGTRIVMSGGLGGVNRITVHPTADLAIAQCQAVMVGDPRRPLLEVIESVTPGHPVKVLGFLRDMMSEGVDGVKPFALTAGDGTIVQISHQAKTIGKQPYIFEGATLNDAIDKGMSGGAVVDAWRPRMLVGLATGQSTRVDGHEYGWILRLGPYRSWLEEQVRCDCTCLLYTSDAADE